MGVTVSARLELLIMLYTLFNEPSLDESRKFIEMRPKPSAYHHAKIAAAWAGVPMVRRDDY